MASSGTYTNRSNRDSTIKGALRLVNAYDPENSSGPTATQISLASEALNALVKAWGAHGDHLWERKYGVIFPQASQGIFVLGSPGPAGDHACLSTPLGSGFVQTTLSASAASGAGSITVTSTSATLSTAGITAATIANSYNIGIQLDSGAVQWTTVNGAPSGTTVTLTATLTGAATAGNNVFCYQTKLYRPLRVIDSFIRDITGGNDSPVRIISKDEYNRFGLKTPTGTAVQIYYDTRVNSGHLYIYPQFIGASKLLFIEFQSPIEDFTSSSDDYDLPQEWELALKFGLAMIVAPEYEVPEEKYKIIEKQAAIWLELAKGFDQEQPQSVSFGLQSNAY